MARWPDDMHELERLGWENLQAIGETLVRYGIDAEWELTGELSVATAEWQLAEMADEAEVAFELGWQPMLLSAEAVRAEVDSPTYLGGLWDREGVAMLHPAKLAWGLAAACRANGVRVYEGTRVSDVRHNENGSVTLGTPHGSVTARRVALGTGAFPPLLRRLRRYVVPVYDYAMATEPLSDAQLGSLGWRHRQGLGDYRNQFHYYRLTADNRTSGAVMTPSTISAVASARTWNGGVPRSRHWRGTSSPRSLNWKGSVSRTHGAVSWTLPRASAPSSEQPAKAAWRTPPDTPAWAWERRVSART
jgi:glycine/D-amino acid oxidase-like deaminating enzyme